MNRADRQHEEGGILSDGARREVCPREDQSQHYRRPLGGEDRPSTRAASQLPRLQDPAHLSFKRERHIPSRDAPLPLCECRPICAGCQLRKSVRKPIIALPSLVKVCTAGRKARSHFPARRRLRH